MYSEQKFLKSFRKQLAKTRKRNGFTQEKLADLIDVHSTYISMVERGARNPSIANVYKMSKALKVDIREFF